MVGIHIRGPSVTTCSLLFQTDGEVQISGKCLDLGYVAHFSKDHKMQEEQLMLSTKMGVARAIRELYLEWLDSNHLLLSNPSQGVVA